MKKISNPVPLSMIDFLKGGTIGQVIKKVSEDDDDFAWQNESVWDTLYPGKNGRISGGTIQWSEEGYKYDISETLLLIDSVPITVPFGDVTLSNGDEEFDRIDLIYVNTTGYYVVEGTPSSNPIEPNLIDPENDFALGFVLVTVNSESPAGVDTDLIYDENLEWVVAHGTTNGSTDSNSFSFPYIGSKSINVSGLGGTFGAPNNNYYASFTKDSDFYLSYYDSISFRLRLKEVMPASGSIRLRFRNSPVTVNSLLKVASVQKNLVDEYQYVSMPISDLQMPIEALSRQLLFYYIAGSAAVPFAGFYIDNIRLQKSNVVVVPPIASPLTDNEVKVIYINPEDLSGTGAIEEQIAEYINTSVSVDYSKLYSKLNYVLLDEGDPITFLQLADTPSEYTGQAGKAVVVNGDEDGLEFSEISGGIQSVTGSAVDNTDPLNPVIDLGVGLEDVFAGTNVTIDKADPLNPIISASIEGLLGDLNVRASNTVIFDKNYLIGSSTSPRSGNILFDFTGAKIGAITFMWHLDASAFTIPSSQVKLYNMTQYSISVANLFGFMLSDNTVSSEKVLVKLDRLNGF